MSHYLNISIYHAKQQLSGKGKRVNLNACGLIIPCIQGFFWCWTCQSHYEGTRWTCRFSETDIIPMKLIWTFPLLVVFIKLLSFDFHKLTCEEFHTQDLNLHCHVNICRNEKLQKCVCVWGGGGRNAIQTLRTTQHMRALWQTLPPACWYWQLIPTTAQDSLRVMNRIGALWQLHSRHRDLSATIPPKFFSNLQYSKCHSTVADTCQLYFRN